MSLNPAADGQHAAVHHVRGGHDVGSGPGVGHGGSGQQVERGVVEHATCAVAFADQPAVAVRGVFAQTHVGNHHQIGPVFLEQTHGPLHNAVFGVSSAAPGIFGCGDAEQQHGFEARAHGLAHLFFQFGQR